MTNTKLLWASKENHYLVPNEFKLPAGETIIWSPTQGQFQVDLARLEPFEISDDEARPHLETEIKDNPAEAASYFMAYAARNATQNDQLSDLIDLSLKDLQDNPQDSLVNWLTQFQTVVEGVTTEDETKQEEAKETLESTQKNLNIEYDLTQVVDALKKLNLGENEQVRQSLAALNTLIEALKHAPEENHPSHDALKELMQGFKTMIDRYQETENEAHYRELARNAVEESSQKHMKPIDVKRWIEDARAKYRQEKGWKQSDTESETTDSNS